MHWFSPACLSRSYAAISVACLSRSYAAISVSAAELILMGVASEASGSEASEASIMVDRERDELRGSSAGSRGQQRRNAAPGTGLYWEMNRRWCHGVISHMGGLKKESVQSFLLGSARI